MKRTSFLIFIVTVCLTVIPFFASGAYKSAQTEQLQDKAQELTESSSEDDYFLVLDTSSDEVLTVSGFDYVCGAVAAEMPLLYEAEALKAQAVAAYTYACREREIQRAAPSKNLKGADLSADPSSNQGYITVENMKKRWGKNFERYYSKLTSLVADVYGKKILYQGQPILAVYHAISGGQTESCATVWGSALPYLVPVESSVDQSVDGYKTEVTFTKEQLKELVLARWPETVFDNDPAKWLGQTMYSDSGTVTQIQIGSAQLTGVSVRHCLQLRSAAFSAKYGENGFTFTVLGYGHGVGMSQTGANQMAKQGADYIEILTHYYSGVTIAG